jgi:hypothetical protein
MTQTPNPALALRSITEMTQTQAASLISVGVSTWKRWEATGTMPATKVEAFRRAISNHDTGFIPTTSTSEALNALKARGRAATLPDYCTADDLFGQKRLEPLLFVPDNGSSPEPRHHYSPAQLSEPEAELDASDLADLPDNVLDDVRASQELITKRTTDAARALSKA